jgi:hypothetical protein
MSLVEKKLGSAILSLIRRRRNQATKEAGSASVRPAGSVKLREVGFSDFTEVAELKRRWNLAEDSYENWQRLWRDNPALAAGPLHPMGWVLEVQGKVVGYLGNIIQLYRYKDRILRSATGHAFVVEQLYRGSGLSLVAAYFRQKNIDLYISTGAIQPVGNIGKAFKSEPLTQKEYQTVLFWVLRPYAFTRSVMNKLSLGAAFSSVAGGLASLMLTADKTVSRRGPKSTSQRLRICHMALNDLGREFDDLWSEKLSEMPSRLFADRMPSTLRWHFETPGDRGSVRVLCCRHDGKLQGYAVVRHEATDESGMRKSIIADMLVKADDAEIVKSLLISAYHDAQQAGSHILEVVGFPSDLRKVFSEFRPYTRNYPTPIFGYKAVDPGLHEAISGGQTWYATPFDGDWSLIRPSYSEPASLAERPSSMLTPESVDASRASYRGVH